MKLYLIVLLILLCGCAAEYKDVTKDFILPKELQEYKVIRLHKDSGTTLYVLVKKDKEDREVIGTTDRSGKFTHTIMVDGEEYIKKE